MVRVETLPCAQRVVHGLKAAPLFLLITAVSRTGGLAYGAAHEGLGPD